MVPRFLVRRTETRSPVDTWFEQIADWLLRSSVLMVGDRAHQLLEVEFYLRAKDHDDPFTHAQARQRTSACWYLHRQGTSLRGGTYKGLDITFGGPDEHGGILIRSLRTAGGSIVNGSSLCVEYLIEATGSRSLASFAASIEPEPIDARTSPVSLREASSQREIEVYRSARVGLSLKRLAQFPTMSDYICRRYRFLTAPHEIRKGRVYLVLALHQQGMSAAEIARTTGCPKHVVGRYLDAYAEGRRNARLPELAGRALRSADLCRMHGLLTT